MSSNAGHRKWSSIFVRQDSGEKYKRPPTKRLRPPPIMRTSHNGYQNPRPQGLRAALATATVVAASSARCFFPAILFDRRTLLFHERFDFPIKCGAMGERDFKIAVSLPPDLLTLRIISQTLA